MSQTLSRVVAVVVAVGATVGSGHAESGRAVPEAPSSAPVQASFRPDAWFLPDEALLGFVEVPEGPFLMGSDPATDPLAFDVERWSTTQAQGTVYVPGFYIARYEVTVAQFRAFAEETGYRVVDPSTLLGPVDHPAVGVAWTDALAYARWLQRALGESSVTPAPLRQLLTDGWRISLPSEAEWEKAARGSDGRIFPWGDRPRADRANFGGRATDAVGSFECSECPFGLADMSGNVWEWTRSPYQPYPYDATDDRSDLESEALWVMRGGSFGDPAQQVRAANRGGADPGVRRPFIGFRLVLSRF